jgi:hypothetical protein
LAETGCVEPLLKIRSSVPLFNSATRAQRSLGGIASKNVATIRFNMFNMVYGILVAVNAHLAWAFRFRAIA